MFMVYMIKHELRYENDEFAYFVNG